ncbi:MULTISPECIES: lysophospholipid acyltransferase family protein [Aneurinibacillus]|uniref:KDO2-lipid IV(A) lauroyltransferase n=1 Tax=Aneurinibacillus thermoaerophilus TaxID=143495 RepID=A0A1G7Z3T1_ANETH|nr:MULTISPECIES: lysophospholipid acyltransferase family protein [Aneurinibacillus]AMA72373.1 hypothetical protein ACH33_05565 [Aneurinibacillus sp. XH2]MED0674768.1 lysophospholipid acyltransferase family protein [Aneurinibacillus thermoaerophilus]MED0679719.1 lysophospholipid acyltransferase family protein [Aneurinibacillus thermoaerophilus]MED0735750.1 lysophospholipid acyltransferase family protein [Aneurinibacillus thermoaerophilus]MED0757958.1 lysophospholipid acyltransferase family prot
MYEWLAKITTSPSRLRLLRCAGTKLPGWLAWLLCAFCAFLLYICSTNLRGRIKQNISEILPQRKKYSLSFLSYRYFFHLFRFLFEIIIDVQQTPSRQKVTVKTEGLYHLEQALRLGRGVVLLTPHTGNFFAYYMYLSKKYPCLTVATASSPELFPLYETFRQMGCRGLDYDTTPPRELWRTLRQHLKKNGVVMLLGDFFRPNFPPAYLFGKPTRCPAGSVTLALESRVPIIPFYGCCTGGFSHRMVFLPPLFLYEQYAPQEREKAMEALTRTLEFLILQAPSQWLYWFNADERWIRRPEEKQEAVN